METKQRPSVDSSLAEETMRSSTTVGAAEGSALPVNGAQPEGQKQSKPAPRGQTKHYLNADPSFPIEEVVFSTLPSGATEVTIVPAKSANHEGLGELRDVYRSLGYDVVVDADAERGAFLKVTAGKAPEHILGVLMDKGVFPVAPEEKLAGEKEEISRFQKFRETALKYATRSAVVSHFILIANGWLTRDPDKAAAGLTFATTNSLAAIRGTGKRGGEVDAKFSKAYRDLELGKTGILPVDTLNFKEQKEDLSALRKGVNKAADFAWNKHPYEIGEVAATFMNAQMTFRREGKQEDKWWLLNTFTSFLAGGTLGFVPPKAHVAEGKEIKYPSPVHKAWNFIQTHSTKIGGVVNIMSNVFAVMSGVKAVKNYKAFKQGGVEAIPEAERLPANDGRKGMLPAVPMNEKQRYFATAATSMATSLIWLAVGLMTFLGDKNKPRDKDDDQVINDLAAKSAELVLQADVAQQPAIAQKLAEYFGEQKDVKGKPEEIYALIVTKVHALRSNPFLGASFYAQGPEQAAAAQKQQDIPQPAPQPSMTERVGASKREGQWAEQPNIASETSKEKPQRNDGKWAEQADIDPKSRKENGTHMSVA